MEMVPLSDGDRCVDFSSTGHGLDWYRHLKDDGIVAVILDGASPGVQGDVERALAAGLRVMLFQGYYPPDWHTLDAAALRARELVDLARALGFPAADNGPTLWLDLEDTGSVSANDMFGWCSLWGRIVRDAGFSAGIYVGAGQPLGSDELWNIVPVSHYWRSASQVPDVAVRGYQLVQERVNQMTYGVWVDYDRVERDRLGGLPIAVGDRLPFGHWPRQRP
jgi:hypothetical protein